MRAVLISSLVLMAVITSAQENQKKLAFDDFKAIVLQHHPLAEQANLIQKKGEATVQMARGGFDPKIETDIGQKYFKDDQYYSLIDAGLKVPTWFGIEFNSGYEQNGGLYLNPENSTSGGGLVYAGVSLAVGRGMFIDERRAELRKAQIFSKSAIVEQRLLLNELLYEAGIAYWKWFKEYEVLKVYTEAMSLAEFRFNSVVAEVKAGDRSAIDTLEASIQLQNRQLSLQQAQLEFKNTAALLSIYMWQNGQIPMEIDERTVPVSKVEVELTTMDSDILDRIDSLVAFHPYLQQIRFKIDQLKIDRRMKTEELKPLLNLKYNALNQVVGDNTFANPSINNYNWGLQFSLPIPLRKERGALKLAKIKIQEAELGVIDQQARIGYKINSAINTWFTSLNQITLYKRTVGDYEGLLNGERQKFTGGESSLFMVNSRELGFIQAQIKYVELLTANQKAGIDLKYSLGILETPEL
ncbi:MAG: TolC family protein [Flavobacteriales bacterium]|nr:TolC family protein [Flavobacteriales bacterium]